DRQIYFVRPGLAAFLLLVLLSATGVFAQTTGTILGTVNDRTGSAMSGVTITVTNEATSAVRTLTTDAVGLYRAELLPVGRYSVQAEKTGFKTTKITGIQVDVQQSVRTDIHLQIGSLTETVNVTSEVPVLKTDTSDVDAVVTQKEVVELP